MYVLTINFDDGSKKEMPQVITKLEEAGKMAAITSANGVLLKDSKLASSEEFTFYPPHRIKTITIIKKNVVAAPESALRVLGEGDTNPGPGGDIITP